MTAEPWSRHLPPGVGSVALGGPGVTVPSVLAQRWSADPARPTLFEAGAPGGWCAAGELEARSAAAAARLASFGLGAGDRMVWSSGPTVAGVVAALAGLRLGAVLVPVNPVGTERELQQVVTDVRPAVAVVERPEQARWVTGTPTATLSPDLDPWPGGAHPAGGDGPAALDTAAPGDPALIVFTSGTTGVPKGAVLSHANVVAGARSLQAAWRWEPEDRLVHALPLCHVHGLCVGLLGTLAAGASAVLLPRFDATSVLEAASDHRASLFFGVPTMYHRLVGTAGVSALGRLRLCVSGSASLPVPLAEQFAERTGVAILERYGMTETLLTYSNPVDGERRPGTVGFALPGVRGRLGGPGDDAELWVRAPTVFDGYWERPAATAECFEDGWFRTGDLGRLDGDGYLAIMGRRRDLIISGGYNVYPAEVEDVLLAHPAVAEVAVTGTPSAEWGETVTAWVVPAQGAPDVDALLAFCAEQLAPYKRPRRVHVVDALPRNAMGKVVRAELGKGPGPRR
ncbi:MAG TPA: AMP-binding protein [Acidimicrobiales bacterium]|nr:AMP-binding protein [Acidimicrobiales bacterium]